ncbi:MAG: bifunctional demethylmenaquinone methyltransferase/2-methoxy-6-polyprenyl-1,4-benzoquinol methylase UbiE [Bacteroidetes bacterium]|nr:bifunctional demethylmenaquinone methyltransferase/2-methoxy-6-polyprenyl-1,4-benzoquinol methylase UbiE [Bacteroidota bacterium]MDA1336636.1 bifunctional demethylmenaquinone methyltransferase/2-methoxy-6-polyprenyl-1,4-benzoquinol methylase UbiE [Bacteroidota bacterium]
MGTRVTPYTQPEQESKKRQVARMFDNIAHSYDFLNHFFSLGIDVLWRKRAIKILKAHLKESGTQDNLHIMDMATGTADFAMETMRIGGENLRITGVDISPGMLEVGRKKVERKGWSDSIALIEGDSADLPFNDETFDAYTVAFGVRNFEFLEQGLIEMRRTLRQDGLGIVLEFSKPRYFPLKQIFHFYFHWLMPTMGKLVSKDASAYSYLPESVDAFPEGDQFLSIMEECGYRSCKTIRLTGGIASIYTGIK